MDLDEFLARSNARARRGRRLARHLFAIPIFFATSLVLLYVVLPKYEGGMHDAGSDWISKIVIGAAVVIFLIGLAWMLRILRSHHEPETGAWRYRDS
jgi:putative effector of murein hydrolase